MLRSLSWFLALLAVLTTAGAAPAAPKPVGLTVEKVVLVMRHGVRPPTKNPPMAAGVAKDAWPAWTVKPGYLTAHGAEGIARVAAYERLALGRAGVVPTQSCPRAADIAFIADSDQRTIKTGEVFAEAFAPGCGLAVTHKPEGVTDPLFSPLDGPNPHFSSDKARAAVLAALPPGGLAAAHAKAKPLLDRLQAIYGCCDARICAAYKAATPCTLSDLVTTLGEGEGKPKLSGALDLASTASEILLLEYTEGKPMAEVGWGRTSHADVATVLALHPLEYELIARNPAVSRPGAAPFLAAAAKGFAAKGPKLTLLFGHDTNIAHIGGALNLRWQIADYPAGDPPPGGALGFELVRDAKGARFVRAFYMSQSMDQLRNLDVLDLAHPPARQVIPIGDCVRRQGDLCPLADFLTLAARQR